jgi:AmmeMemoRadiSam system protein B
MPDMSPTREVRLPAVAGRFYPGDADTLARDVRGFLDAPGQSIPRSEARMVMVPHAGYRYSGAIAGETYRTIRPRTRAVVLCPNHTGLGERRAVSPARAWQLPGGDVRCDDELRELLVQHVGLVCDAAAHAREHAIEVQLPFLRAMAPAGTFAAVCLAGLSLDECLRAGEGIARAVRAASAQDGGEILLVASTDMSHYVPAEVARKQDELALDRVRGLDPEGLYETVQRRRISMCGYVPATVAIAAARALGATSAEIVRYGNSGETSGDLASVVGYAGARVA